MSTELKFLYRQIQEGKISHEEAAKALRSIGSRHNGEASPADTLKRSVVSGIVSIVAGLLRVRAEDIDLYAELQELGFDQVLIADLVRKLNQEYDLELTSRVLADYRTLDSLVDHLLSAYHDLLLKRLPPAVSSGTVSQDENKAAPAAGEGLLGEATAFFTEQLSSVIKLPVRKIDPDAALERYGIDSVMVVELIGQLEKTFGSLPKTLFFEYQTIRELAAYFVGSHREKLTAIFRRQQPSTSSSSGPAAGKETQSRVAGRRRRRFASDLREPLGGSAGNGLLDIAIIGLSGRYPQARDIHEYWRNLRDGKDCITEIPKDRWDHSIYFDRDKNKLGRTYSKWGGFMEGVDLFDPLFFNISPREAMVMDPQERLFLQCVYQTLEDAGYTREALRGRWGSRPEGRVGVYVGVMWNEYQLYGAQETVQGRPVAFTGNPSSIANRVSYFCNFHGPSIAIDTMCSSSLTSIHLACQSLQTGKCDLAIAGGVNVSIHPNKYLLLAQARFVSSNGRCQSFGEGGDGYVPGEGVGAVLLKPLAKAVADGDHIYGVIKASAVNHGGKTNGYTVPNPSAQSSVIAEALRDAGIHPRTISYIEAHGTGTSLGDPIEIAGLTRAFEEQTRDRQFCAIGSAKSNVGHCESAAGIAAITKVLLQMQHRQLAPSLHAKTLNPNIDFSITPFIVQQELADWKRPVVTLNGETREYPRRAGVSSFGAGGANAHIVIEEYIAEDRRTPAAPMTPSIIVLSAKNVKRLSEQAEQLLHAVTAGRFSDPDLPAMAYTLQTGREAMEERLALTAASTDELKEKLQGFVEGRSGIKDLYRGRVNGPDDPRPDSADRTGGRTHGELLEGWVIGSPIDWNSLYREGRPGRISLPTYPFAKERCWAVGNVQTSIAAAGRTGDPLHPLLQENTSDLSEQRFSSVFSGEEFFLADHRVQGQRVLPGAAYLEMARAAVERATGRSDAVIRLKNVVWARPLAVNSRPAQVHIGLFPEENEEIEYEVYTASEANGREPIVHSQGNASFISAGQMPVLDLSSLRARLDRNRIGPERCYEAFKTMGLEYGPSHRGIELVYAAPDEALARLSLPASLSNGRESFVLHPSIIDSALQSSIGLAFGAEAQGETGVLRPSLPFALAELEIYGGSDAVMWAWVRPSEGSRPDDVVRKLDIDVCDEQGNVKARMKGFSSRVLDAVSASKTSPASVGCVLLETTWKEQRVPENTAEAYGRHMVFVCEPYSLSACPPEVRCVHLRSDAAGMEERYRDAAVRAFEEVQQILNEKPAGKVLIQAVVAATGEQSLLAGLSGLLKTARLENPNIVGQVIELDPNESPEAIVRKLKDNGRSPGDAHIRYKDGKRYVAVLNEIDSPAAEPGVPWKENGVYLITGGAGGLGLIIAKEIARTAKKGAVILTGRSLPGEDKQKRLKELEAPGCRVAYRQADVTSKESIAGLVREVTREFGDLNGIVHAAGVIRDNFIIRKTTGEFQEVLAPKVAGLVNLDEATRECALDFFVLFSSVAGAAGNIGQSDYATANAFMDAYADYRNERVGRNERRGRTVSLNWPLWKEGGMQVSAVVEKMMMQTAGIVPLQTVTGIRALYQCMASGRSRLMVLEGKPDAIRATFVHKAMVADASVPGSPVRTDSGPSLPAGEEQLREKAVRFLKQRFSAVMKLPAHRIDAQAQLEKYGIDSIMIMDLVNQLEQSFGSLPKTLFFEYQTITALAGYFVASHRDKLTTLLGAPQEPAASAPAPEAVSVQHAEAAVASPSVRSRRRSRFASTGPDERTQKEGAPDVAIIGVSGRYPHARDVQEFWQNLRDGKDCVTEIPKDRWDHSIYFDPDKNKAGTTYSKWGGFLDGVDRFDPLFFNISPAEAEAMDPQERLFLECVHHTLEDAGYTREGLSAEPGSGLGGNVGVYVGAMWAEYQLYGAQETALGRPTAVSSNASSIANRVSYFCNFHGPSMTIETMCSSSLTAIHLACQSLQSGKCDLAVAGGVNVSVHPNKYLLLARGKFISSKGRCESFGEGGDGYVPGEGVGAVLLKPLAKAVADGDHIYGVIKASAVNHGGKTNGYPVPNPAAQSRVIAAALREAGIDPRTISYIEAHGTGTSLGDPIEIAGLTRAFEEQTRDRQFCAIGSAKSNIGHCESAAGIAAITKVLLQMQHGQLAPSLHAKTLNPNIDFSATPFIVQQELADWKRPVVTLNGETREYPRRAGVSSFGAGGANAHIVIEEYVPVREEAPVRVTAENPAVVVLSARNEERLKEYTASLLKYLEMHPDPVSLADVAFTLQTGRDALDERLALLASTAGELRDRLQRYRGGQKEIEGVYRGNARTREENQKLIFEGKAGRDFIAALAREGRSTELAVLWTSGVEIDWHLMYVSGRPKRIPLPKYPFARERCWLPQGPQTDREHPSGHPLIDRIDLGLSLNDGIVFEKVLRKDDPVVNDYKVDDAYVLPVAAQLEMARAAASKIRDGALIAISGISFGQPLVVQDDKKKVRIVIREEGQQLSYMIQTNGSGPAIIHSQGSVAVTERAGQHEERLPLDEVKKRSTGTINDQTLYARLKDLGIVCGPAYRSVSTIWSNDQEALARLNAAPAAATGTGAYVLSPAIMKGALQAALYLAGSGVHSGQLLQPESLGRVEIIRPPDHAGYAYVRGSADRKAFDIDIADEAGSVCVRLSQVSFRSSADALRNFFYTPEWRETPSDAAMKAREGRTNRSILIVHSSGSLGLETALSEAHAGDRITTIRLGSETIRHAERTWEVRTEDPAALGDCIGNLEKPDTVYYLGGLQTSSDSGDEMDLLEQSQKAGVLSLFRLVKAFSDLIWMQEPMELKVVTNSVHAVKEGEAMRPYAAGLLGFVKSAAKEYPQWQVSCIDISGDELRANQAGDRRSTLVQQILDEAGSRDGEEVALRGGKRYVRAIEPVYLPPAVHTPFRRQGVYLILGGAGGIGLELSRHLAETVQAKVVLIGRSELDDEKKEKLSRIEAAGGQVLYARADAGDIGSMRAAIDTARQRFGRINGVIHAAAVLKDKTIRSMDEAAFRSALDPKTKGSAVLHAALQGEHLDFMMFFSSVNSFTANAGQSNYAAGCTFQDAYARSLGRSASYPVKIINWGYWGSVGIAASEEYNKRMQAQGVLSIEPEEGMEAVKRILAQPLDQIVAVKMDDRLRKALEARHAAGAKGRPAGAVTQQKPGPAVDMREWLRTNMSEGLQIPLDKIDDDIPFSEFGVDSVLTILLVKKVEDTFGIKIDPAAVMTYPTVSSLSSYLQQMLSDQQKSSAGAVCEETHPHIILPPGTRPHPVPLPEGEGLVDKDKSIGDGVADKDASIGGAPPDQDGEMRAKQEQIEKSIGELFLYLGQALLAAFQSRKVFRDAKPVRISDIRKGMKILPGSEYMLQVFLAVLEKNGLITLEHDRACATREALSDEIQADIRRMDSRSELLMRALPDFTAHFRLFQFCAEEYPRILTGDSNPEQFFSRADIRELVRTVYKAEHRSSRSLNAVISGSLTEAIVSVAKSGKELITIEDRGLNTFGLSRVVLNLAQERAKKVVCYYARTPGVLGAVEEEIRREACPQVEFRPLNGDRAAAGCMDILILNPHQRELLFDFEKVRRRLSPEAFIVLAEPLESVYLAMTFGLLDEAWTSGCADPASTKALDEWTQMLSAGGFHIDELFREKIATATRTSGITVNGSANKVGSSAAVPGKAQDTPDSARLFGFENLLSRDLITTSRGHDVEYFTCGRGEPVVFLTALAFTRSIWKYQIEEFAGRYHLIFPHLLPGHAGSTYAGKKFTFEDLADDLAELMDHLGLPAVHLVGWCMAGNVAQLYELRHRGRLKSLTLVCTTPTDARTRGLDSRDLKRYTANPLGTYELEFQNIYQDRYATDDTVREYFEVIRRSSCTVQEEAMLHHIYGVFQFDSTDRLKDISAPTLVLSGKWDIAFPPDQVVLLHKGIRNSRFHEFELAGHMPFLSQHETFNPLLQEFIEEHKETGRAGKKRFFFRPSEGKR